MTNIIGVQHDNTEVQNDKENFYIEQNDCHPENASRHPELDSGSHKGDRPLVKICGLTCGEDVLFADQLGADFVGFIFAAGFGRNVCGEKFEKLRLILPQIHAKKVAVITDVESEEAKAAVRLVKGGILDMLQLHGIDYKKVPAEIKKLPHYFAVTDKKVSYTEQNDCHPENASCHPEQENRHPELVSGSVNEMLKQDVMI